MPFFRGDTMTSGSPGVIAFGSRVMNLASCFAWSTKAWPLTMLGWDMVCGQPRSAGENWGWFNDGCRVATEWSEWSLPIDVHRVWMKSLGVRDTGCICVCSRTPGFLEKEPSPKVDVQHVQQRRTVVTLVLLPSGRKPGAAFRSIHHPN